MDKRRILLVDDEAAFTRLLKSYLDATGRYEVQIENRGTQAVARTRLFRPDLILLDVIMPDVDGGRVAEELKADAELRKIPVIFLTAIVSRDEVQTHAGSIGGQLFIAKPVSMEEMLASIERQIRQPSDSGAAVNGAARAS